jgi:hypothetical protein
MKVGIVQAARIAVAEDVAPAGPVDELDLIHAAPSSDELENVAVDELDLVHASSSEGEFDDADYVQVSKEDAPAMEILEFEVDDAGVDKHKQALDVFDRDSDDEFSSARNVT